ncbi:MAG: ATP-binding protein [Phascolarctobacterium sp.]|nr:ATP-binding protein [Phascolarctobacterium sp.]
MAIVKPEKMNFENQKFSAIIYGSPGVGKTTLACSAPSPVLIDFDRGVSRVRADHRCPTIICETYEEVLQDIHSPEMAEFETVIIDTGGSFVTFLKDWAMRTKPGALTKSGDFNGLKGFGFVKSEFANFVNIIKTVLNKNVIFIFHTDEKADKDGNPIQRLVCEGSVKNTVWNSCDFGGYVQMIGTQRTICFTPEQEFFAKGTHGIHGKHLVPILTDEVPNNFMTNLFKAARNHIKAEKDYFVPLQHQYDETMAKVKEVLDNVVDAETANAAVDSILNLPHALTSKKEASALLKQKTDALGLVYSREGGYATKVV